MRDLALTLSDRARPGRWWWRCPARCCSAGCAAARSPCTSCVLLAVTVLSRCSPACSAPRTRCSCPGHDLQRAAHRARCGRRRSASASALWSGRRLAARGDVGGRGPRAGAAGGGQPPRAGRLGLARPAHAAGRAAGDGRGAGGRRRRRPGHGRRLPPPDPGRDRPDGPARRRPVRAVPDQRRRAAPVAGRRCRSATSSPTRSRRPRRSRPRRACSWSPRRPAGRRYAAASRSCPDRGEPAAQRDPVHPVGRHGVGRPAVATSGGGWLAVTDACGGIPEADLPRVFDVAFRGEPARTPDARGHGARPAAAAGSGWRSCAAWSRRTAATWRWPTSTGGCRFVVHLPAS